LYLLLPLPVLCFAYAPQHINNLTQGVQQLEKRNKELEEQLKLMEMLISTNVAPKSTYVSTTKSTSKSDPEVFVTI
jgi:hypothetical protein